MANSIQATTSPTPEQMTIRDHLSRIQQRVIGIRNVTSRIEANLDNSPPAPPGCAKEGVETSPPVGVDKWLDQLDSSLGGIEDRLQSIANRI